jgi:hypothetical protein
MNSSNDNKDWIDGSLYPERDVPDELPTLADRVDFIVRLCGAWDFGIPPKPQTFQRLLQEDWREAVDQARLLTSSAYHLLRELHKLDSLPYLGPSFPEILNDPCFDLV